MKFNNEAVFSFTWLGQIRFSSSTLFSASQAPDCKFATVQIHLFKLQSKLGAVVPEDDTNFKNT